MRLLSWRLLQKVERRTLTAIAESSSHITKRPGINLVATEVSGGITESTWANLSIISHVLGWDGYVTWGFNLFVFFCRNLNFSFHLLVNGSNIAIHRSGQFLSKRERKLIILVDPLNFTIIFKFS